MPDSIRLNPIGEIFSEHKVESETPIQPVFAKGACGRVELFPEYEEGLKDLDGFSHIVLLYYFNRANSVRLTAKPFLDDVEHGVFATCAPCRPNRIGTSVVRLMKRQGATLFVEDLDILDGTPLLDIKPYVPRFNVYENVRSGWLTSVDSAKACNIGSRGGHRWRKRKEKM